MARKRMFDTEIINQDRFLDLSIESKAIYFLLGMNADDEGFVSSKRILKLYGGTEKNLKELVSSEFIIKFTSGVVVITDWNANNWLDRRRMKETIYLDEKKLLTLNSSTNKYELANAKPMLRENRIEENSIEENRIEEIRVEENSIEEILCLDAQDCIPYSEIIDYLNMRTGHQYKSSVQKNRTLIHARWMEGFRLEDFKEVIDKKAMEWIGSKMEQYLRPETLFGTKFEGYLNQPFIKREITTEDISKTMDWEEYLNDEARIC